MRTKDSGSVSSPSTSAEPLGCGSLISRLSWMVVGSGAITATLFGMAATREHRLGWRGMILVVLVLATLAARYGDITRFGGTTANGAPADIRTFVRYAVGLVAVVAGLWTAIHLLGA